MPPHIPDSPHALPADAVAAALETRPDEGLTAAEAARRLRAWGPNHLRRRKPRSLLAILLHQFQSVVVYLLAAAAALSLATGDHVEAAAVLVVLALNGAIGFFTEWRAARSMEALSQLAEARTRVRREGRVAWRDARDLTPGDIVLLEAGDVITADLRLLRSAGLQCDESVLTGEAVPVDKDPAPVPEETVLSDRRGMAYKGASVTRGTAEAIITGIGMTTEIGRISALVQEARPAVSPLEMRLGTLGHKLIWLTLGLSAATVAAGLLRGHPPADIVKTGVALAVAAVPEGLPVVATLCLARGMWRMARRNALITRLSSVETLGATTLILTDKTGTLTENRMTVARYLTQEGEVNIPPLGPIAAAPGGVTGTALRIGALCNAADEGGGEAEGAERGTGDPMELALLTAARRAGLGPDRTGLVLEHAFDPDLQMMSQVHAEGTRYLYAVKGAPEKVIAHATHVLTASGPRPLEAGAREDWLARLSAAAAEGMRCLALAMKHADSPDNAPYADLTLVALVALADPIRPDVPPAIEACRRAGIRVVMVTGDHAETAARIAQDAGLCHGAAQVIEGRELAGADPGEIPPALARRLLEADVFARVAPETKMALVAFFQRSGQVVAMIGDGVNDAPALVKADIGVAMGHRGTQVAREAAVMVLRDDSFPTIVTAVREGRIIFDNIRKFVVYLMSCNLSEVFVVALAVGAGLPAPLLPLQILFLNLVTDVFPAFALGLGRGTGNVLERPPRASSEPIMGRGQWLAVGWLGAAITAATLLAFVLAHSRPELAYDEAVTVAFVTLSLAQLWNVFNLRPRGSRLSGSDEMRNPFVFGAIAFCLLLLAAALGIPALAELLGLSFPGWGWMGAALGLSLLPSLGASVVLAR